MKILIVQTAFLGDVILSTPVITGIRKIYPKAEIHFLTTSLAAPIIESFIEIKNVIKLNKAKGNRGIKGLIANAKELESIEFDLCLNLHKSYRTALILKLAKIKRVVAFRHAKLSFLYDDLVEQIGEHAVERNYSILNFQSVRPDLNFTLPIIENSEAVLTKFGISDKFIVIAPGSVWFTKRWSARHYQSLARQLNTKGWQVVGLGSASEKELVDFVVGDFGSNLAGKTSLQESFSLLSRASCLVCNDSMILHAASALKVPTVAVFCATSPKFGFGPYQERAVVVENKSLVCKPCSRHGQKSCPLYTNSCMEDVHPQEVISELEKLLMEESRVV